ncbi:membrane-spanning 4-domains subfamily A member 15-like isoform X2 [Anolis sagrei]|uniref:membrane-spanning 4-domains subfamily A member 15-like isoform X2 n=1 Tax=Anolis sagrei TaxID=38937 RepID=UPI00351FBBE8
MRHIFNQPRWEFDNKYSTDRKYYLSEGIHLLNMASGTVVHIPFNGANTYQAGQGFPDTGTDIHQLGQQFGSPSNSPEQNPQPGPLEKLAKVELKTLGAVQIMIGLIHFGFGAVSFGWLMAFGGLFFIASGSLSVAVEKRLTLGLIQYVTTGIYILLLLFILLEFCITVSAIHFGCQATCCKSDPEAVVYVPCTIGGDTMMLPEIHPSAPPIYESLEPCFKGNEE